MFGLLNINKPVGLTSRRVVDRIQNLTRPDKAGHAGTLDPLAEGVLVLGVGAATRLLEYVQRMPKSYHAHFVLGKQSPTDDIEGQVISISHPPVPSRKTIEKELKKLTGPIKQRPPIFSALKFQGRRAYDLARSGQVVAMPLREVTLHTLQIIEYSYPELILEITCSSGTYVRAVGRDLAESLGTSAVMSALTRTAIGSFRLETACELVSLNEDSLTDRLLAAVRAVEGMPTISLTPSESIEVGHGRPIPDHGISAAKEVVAMHEGKLLAILHRKGPEKLSPKKVFPVSNQPGRSAAVIAR
jgi:tRNA pseudouridine55 synthase